MDHELRKHALPPWCVGSVFPASQLITGAAADPLGPLLFDYCGTECLLDTGYPLEYSYHNYKEKPYVQVRKFFESHDDVFFPADILLDNLQEDASLNIALAMNSKQLLGNRLQCIKCRKGSYQLFFPMGMNMDRIGGASFLLKDNSTSIFSPGVDCLSSSSVDHPILQIAALGVNQIGESDDTNIFLAVRTSYQVHWLTAQLEGKGNHFKSRAVASFESCSSHVSWNPHFRGEAAAVLETGEIRLFDLNIAPNEVSKPTTYLPYLRQVIPRCKNGSLIQKNGKKHTGLSVDFGHSLVDSKWWRCEYSWHPRTLLLAGCKEICLVDLREKLGSRQVDGSSCTSILANISSLDGLSTYCNQLQKEDCFGAFARADYDGMYQFATATNRHLLLFDVRQPLNPLLQWEHGMMEEPPGLLFMSPLSSLRPLFGSPFRWSSCAGKVLLAAACRSGDMHAFSYGPEPPANLPAWECVGNRLAHTDSDFDEVMYSWGLPSKLDTSKETNIESDLKTHFDGGRNGKNQECAILSRANLHHEKIAGLCIIPYASLPTKQQGHQNDEGQVGFNMLQLTGSGAIVAQKYKVSSEINSQPLESDLQLLPHKEVIGKVKISNHCYKLEHLPAFLSYIQKGSVLPASLSVLNTRLLHGPDTGGEQKEKLNEQRSESKTRDILLGLVKPISSLVSIYEISQKVIWRSLPTNLAHVAVQRQKDPMSHYTGLDFLQIYPFKDKHLLLVDSNDMQTDIKGSECEESKSILVGPAVPLPVVLEIEKLREAAAVSSNLPSVQERRNIKYGSESGNARTSTLTKELNLHSPELTWLSGHNELSQRCGQVKQVIEELYHEKLILEKNESIVTLSDSMDLWSTSQDGEECKESQNLIFHFPTMLSNALAMQSACCMANDDKLKRLPAVSPVLDDCKRMLTRHEQESQQGISFLEEDVFCRFLGSRSCEVSCEAEKLPFSQIDCNLCPVKMAFKTSGS